MNPPERLRQPFWGFINYDVQMFKTFRHGPYSTYSRVSQSLFRKGGLKMIIICFSDYPIQSAKEVTKRFMELPRLPDFVRGKGNYVYSTTKRGYHNISILEVDDAKAKEAFDAVMKAYLNFLDIPGYSYDIKVCYKASDAIALMA
jgi:hypothetical protein